MLHSVNYFIWLSLSILKSGWFCELWCVCVCRFGQFACAYRSAKWQSNKLWIYLLHSHNSVLDCGIQYSGIFCECLVCHWEWLLSTCPNVFAMTCVQGGTIARNLWGSWTVVSAVLWQSFLVQPCMWRLFKTRIISGGLFFINVTSNTGLQLTSTIGCHRHFSYI